jgi:transposase
VGYTWLNPNTEPKIRRQIMKNNITIVGLDTHKNSIDIVTAEAGGNQEIRYYGKIGGDMASLDKAIRKLQSKGATLRFVYEAGPCGYEVYRHLTKRGLQCAIIAPSMTPQKSGDRIKTDRRDAEKLARLERAGELTHIYVPREDDEAMRDLTRGREDAVLAQRTARQRLGAFLLRYGHRYPGKKAWGPTHMRWLAGIAMPHPAQQLTLQEYINTVREGTERINRLTEQIQKLLPDWRMAPVVKAIQALRGVAEIVAVNTVAELGDMRRFTHPSEVMNYLGLVPSLHISAEHVKQGGITKTGNGHVRRVLVEAAHAYGFPARISKILLKRQEGLPQPIKDISWKAQLRLCGRFRRLITRGKHRNKVVIAIARELVGFIWSIAIQVEPAKLVA